LYYLNFAGNLIGRLFGPRIGDGGGEGSRPTPDAAVPPTRLFLGIFD
jgi:hypothetical protein